MIRLARSAALAAAILFTLTPLSIAMAQGNSETHRNDQNNDNPGNDGQGNEGRGNTGGGGESGTGGGDGGGGQPESAIGPGPESTPPGNEISPPGDQVIAPNAEALLPSPEADSDSERALEAVRSHRAMPLEDIAATAAEDHPGKLIDAELITVEDFLLYELKLLEPDGDVRTVYYYARSGIEVRGN